MKRLMIMLVAAMCCISCTEQFNAAYLLSSGAKIAQAATLSDAQIQAYVSQYVAQLDAQNAVRPESNAYVKRVRNLTHGLTDVDGIPLTFKVGWSATTGPTSTAPRTVG